MTIGHVRTHNREVTITADTPVRALPGAGPMRAKQLEEAGFATAGDLIYFLPYRYEDRRHPVRIADVGRYADTPVLLRGKVMSANMHTTRLKRMKVFEKKIPGLVSLRDRVAARPKIKAYLESERRIPFNDQGIFRFYKELDG